jgi:hypothetical protein
MYWYKTEIKKVGFLQEDEIDKNGFPDNIYDYPAFISYIKEFYPKYVSHEIKPFKENYDVVLHFNDGHFITMPMEKFADKIERIEPDKLKELQDEGYFNDVVD